MEEKLKENGKKESGKKEEQSSNPPRKSSGRKTKSGNTGIRNAERKIKNLENKLKEREKEIKTLKKQLSEKKAIDPDKVLDLVTDIFQYLEKHRGSFTRNRELREISRMVSAFFNSNGIKLLGREGEKYDPVKHEALLLLNDEAVQPGKITEVKSPGIRKGRTVIRKAKVLVSKTRS